MRNTFRMIGKEFNPWYDLERLHALTRYLAPPKTMVRGIIMGGTLGALLGFCNSAPVKESCSAGVLVGIQLDFYQYMVRYLYHKMKAQNVF